MANLWIRKAVQPERTNHLPLSVSYRERSSKSRVNALYLHNE
jgi:hypothetical protein